MKQQKATEVELLDKEAERTVVRKALLSDLDAVEQIYNELHEAEENSRSAIGWRRGVYPIRDTAEGALERAELFVIDNEGVVLGAGIINQRQMDAYFGASWEHDVNDDRICVLHTLVVSPEAAGKGLGKLLVNYYEEYARTRGFYELRLDTNEINKDARAFYHKLGFKEIAVVPTVFNGIDGVNLVLLEKWIGD